MAYRDKIDFNNTVYDKLYQCLPCAEGCSNCADGSPCMAHYDWVFRYEILAGEDGEKDESSV